MGRSGSSCRSCRFFGKVGQLSLATADVQGPQEFGECRRFPPSSVRVSWSGRGVAPTTGFLIVDAATPICGEYRAVSEEARDARRRTGRADEPAKRVASRRS
jgi:hypothetical protein